MFTRMRDSGKRNKCRMKYMQVFVVASLEYFSCFCIATDDDDTELVDQVLLPR